MNIDQAKQVYLRTHLAALEQESRAACYMMEAMPGVGKSEGMFQYAQLLAERLGQPVGLRQFMATTITSPDARGFMMPVKSDGPRPNTVFSVPPWYPTRINIWVYVPSDEGAGEGTWYAPGTWEGEVPDVGILFLDEWGQGDEDIKKPLAELILHSGVGDDYLPIGWRVAAAQNRMSDRSGTVREMMFIVNRRGLLLVSSSLQPWLAWAHHQPVETKPHYMTISFAEKHPGVVFRDAVPDDPTPFCTPRSLVIMDREVRALASDDDRNHDRFPMDEIAREVCAGWIGEGAAGQFMAHLKFADVLPDMQDIIDAPSRAKLPEGKDAQLVCSYMLAQHITEDNAQNILRYVLRMQAEMQILSVGIISADDKRKRFLVPVPEYNTWLMRNKDRMIAAQS
jgi:hypothetical protein